MCRPQHPAKPNQWQATLEANIDRFRLADIESLRSAHRRWWRCFWDRSWIRISGAKDAEPTARGYVLQRYLTVCGGRGNAGCKFNGSIFTLPWENKGPDYRRWGGAQWFQNARLLYWPTIASGDYDVTATFYRTYLAALPLAKQRTRIYFGHDGAYFPETLYLWGTHANADYGWKREKQPVGFCDNSYVRYYWQGGLELSAMMLEQYANTQERQFATDTLLPLTTAIVQFYDHHYERDAKGKLHFAPAASLETWHVATNPLPEIAGLRYVLGRLLALPTDLTTEAERDEMAKDVGRAARLADQDRQRQEVSLAGRNLHKVGERRKPRVICGVSVSAFWRRARRNGTCPGDIQSPRE